MQLTECHAVGIGTETVRSLADAGARVVFSSRNLEAGNKVAADVSKSGVKVSCRYPLQSTTAACLIVFVTVRVST